MIQLTPHQITSLRDWFTPDKPGPLIGLHVIQTGHGACWVDRWPNPRAVLVETAGNYSLAGDPNVLRPDSLKRLVQGFVEAPPKFTPLLRAAFSGLQVWDRVILELKGPPQFTLPPEFIIRRLEAADTQTLNKLSAEVTWIGKTWGGLAGMAASGYAWGAFAGERVIAIACTFFVGDQYEEIGVVTEPAFRGMGLSVACAGLLCADIQQRGRRASWSTSPDNIASLRVAQKLGFVERRRDCLYVVGISIPESPQREGEG
jgi:RimJ/RimL family protein N-acetyltransferase